MKGGEARLIETIYGYPSGIIKHSVRIKRFVVVEHVNPMKGSSYLYLARKPSGIDFISYINRLKRKLGEPRYAGIKDSLAIAYFHISSNKEISNHKNIWLIGRAAELSLSHNTGNTFRIDVQIETSNKAEFEKAREELCGKKDAVYMANFYGYQRFGLKRPVNHLIGKALIGTRYNEAWYHVSSMHSEESLPLIEAKMFKKAVKRLSIVPPYDRGIRDLVIESYTSYLFNRSLTLYLQENMLNPCLTYEELSGSSGITPRRLPCGKKIVTGFYLQRSTIKELADNIGKIEYLKPRIGLYSKRPVFVPVCNYSCRENNGEVFSLSFTLPKGSYATSLFLAKGFWAK